MLEDLFDDGASEGSFSLFAAATGKLIIMPSLLDFLPGSGEKLLASSPRLDFVSDLFFLLGLSFPHLEVK